MKKIVIIGGGAAGVSFAQTIAEKLSPAETLITLIEKNDYYYHVFGSLRGIVDKSYIPKLFIPYDDAFPNNGNFVFKQATVTSISYESRTVTYESRPEGNDGRLSPGTSSYDYLILATGSSYPPPIKPGSGINSRKDIENSLLKTGEKIKEAESVLVIGGGAVGIEMAGEVKSFYPNKKVMLIDNHSELLSNQNVPKLRKPLKAALENLGVELILGQRLNERFTSHHFETKRLVTDRGAVIESDVQLVCAGMKPNIGLMTDPACVDGNFIKVKDTMQVDRAGYENVFVLGDASNHPTPKMGYWAGEQGKHLGKTLAKYIQNGSAIEPFEGPSTEAILVPVGPNGGVSQLPLCGGVTVGNFFTRMMKSKDLFAGMTWENLKADMPN